MFVFYRIYPIYIYLKIGQKQVNRDLGSDFNIRNGDYAEYCMLVVSVDVKCVCEVWLFDLKLKTKNCRPSTTRACVCVHFALFVSYA